MYLHALTIMGPSLLSLNRNQFFVQCVPTLINYIYWTNSTCQRCCCVFIVIERSTSRKELSRKKQEKINRNFGKGSSTFNSRRQGNKKIFRTLLLKWSNFGIVKATYFYKLLGGPFQNWNEPALQSIISVYLCSSMRTESFVMHIILDFANTVDRGVLKPMFLGSKIPGYSLKYFFKKGMNL